MYTDSAGSKCSELGKGSWWDIHYSSTVIYSNNHYFVWAGDASYEIPEGVSMPLWANGGSLGEVSLLWA